MNGSIDDGSEVFGAQTIPQVNWGFGALQHLEPNNGDGAIDKQDPIYAKLLLWSDRNANGRSEAEELSPLSATFARVGLGFSTLARIDDNGNRFENSGWAVFLKDFQNKADDPILATVEVFPVVTHKPGR